MMRKKKILSTPTPQITKRLSGSVMRKKKILSTPTPQSAAT